MPPRIEPKTLQEISLNKTASLTNKLCFHIERKYGGWNCPASRKQLEMVKQYLSPVQPLMDDLCKSIFDLFFMRHRTTYQHFHRVVVEKYPHDAVNNKYLLLEVLLSDKLKILKLNEVGSMNDCFTDSAFWKNKLLKLKNLVELDILNVRLTDESFHAIGDVCTNLREIRITSDLHYACMESVTHILKCRELQNVRIDFHFWEEASKYEYMRMFITGLPKLEHFYDWLQWDFEDAIAIATPVPSMREIRVKSATSAELLAILRLCPNLKVIWLGVHDEDDNGRPNYEEKEKVLKTLAESSLQLQTLYLNLLIFNEDMTRIITSRCSNLTRLELDDCEGKRMSVNNIYTIGISCPKIEDLRISESYCDVEERRRYVQLHSPDFEEQTFLTTPRMFVHLKVLFLHSNVDWDQRILPLILRHANDLTDISLRDIFKPTSTHVDMLSEILNCNALRELESLALEVECYGGESYTISLPVHSIERLVDCCPKLCELDLRCPMEYETIRYLRELASDMQREQFEFSLKFEPVIDYA